MQLVCRCTVPTGQKSVHTNNNVNECMKIEGPGSDLAARAGAGAFLGTAAGADSPSSASEPISSSASSMTPSEPSAGPSDASTEASVMRLAGPILCGAVASCFHHRPRPQRKCNVAEYPV